MICITLREPIIRGENFARKAPLALRMKNNQISQMTMG
jgi:hypothetical protein